MLVCRCEEEEKCVRLSYSKLLKRHGLEGDLDGCSFPSQGRATVPERTQEYLGKIVSLVLLTNDACAACLYLPTLGKGKDRRDQGKSTSRLMSTHLDALHT